MKIVVDNKPARPPETASEAWDGTTCLDCGIVLTRDTVWCAQHRPFAPESAADKARCDPREDARRFIQDIVRNWIRVRTTWWNEFRLSVQHFPMDEEQTRAKMLELARVLPNPKDAVRNGGPPGSAGREELRQWLYRVISEEAKEVALYARLSVVGLAKRQLEYLTSAR
jgi:hypothetical protein